MINYFVGEANAELLHPVKKLFDPEKLRVDIEGKSFPNDYHIDEIIMVSIWVRDRLKRY